MRKYISFAETEQILRVALGLPGSSIKSIAEATGIKANTLYKWKTTPVHLSPEKADCLLFYLMENEPARLELAEKVVSSTHWRMTPSSTSSPQATTRRLRDRAA